MNKDWVASPIVGPTKLRQLEELVEASDIRLKRGDTERLEEPYRPHPVLGHE